MEYRKTLKKIKKDFFGTSDLAIKELITATGYAAVVYFDAMIDKEQVDRGVIEPLIEQKESFTLDMVGLNGILRSVNTVSPTKDYDKMILSISAGDALLLLEGCEEFFVLSVRKYPSRAVAEPPTTPVIKGPREGFTEDLKTNTVLIRRKLRTNKLVFEEITVGRFTETKIAIAYIKGISDEKLVETVRQKIEKIDIDGILDSSYITKFLEEKPTSIFKQVGNTEKPDSLVAKMLNGRIAVLVDGSPIALTVPFLFMEDFKDAQDNFKRSSRASFLRIIRLGAIIFAVILPSIFVALQEHQFQMLPTKLMITIINAEQGNPFTPVVEMLIALILFEILSEASIRMPRYVGMALSVVGALVLGDTAVKAGILSSITVLIVALSGIGLFAIPDEVGMFSILRVMFVMAAGLLGMFGIMLMMVAILAYLTALQSYGVPYLAPFAPIIIDELKDSLVKQSLDKQEERPRSLNNKNKRRLNVE